LKYGKRQNPWRNRRGVREEIWERVENCGRLHFQERGFLSLKFKGKEVNA